MDGIIPPVNPSPAPQLNLQAAIADAENPQAAVAKLPLNTVLTGLVMGNDKVGNPVIKLGSSEIVLGSPIPLGKNSQIQLKLDSISGSITPEVLTVDGKLPAQQPQQNSNNLGFAEKQPQQFRIISVNPQGTTKLAETAPQQAQQIVRTPDTVSLSTTQISQIKAMVINPSPEIMQGVRTSFAMQENKSVESNKLVSSAPEELKAGSQLSLKVTGSITPPPPQNKEGISGENRTLAKQDWMQKENMGLVNKYTGQQPAETPEELPNPQNPTKQQPQNRNTSPQQYQASSQPELQEEEGSKQPNSPKQALPENARNNFAPEMKMAENGNLKLNALVLDSKPNGEVLAETKLGKLIIDGNPNMASIPRGSVLSLEVEEFLPAQAAEFTEVENEIPLAQLARKWPALNSMLSHINTQGHDSETTSYKLAGSQHELGARLMKFIKAVNNENPEEWIGKELANVLDADDIGSDILGKLKGDFSLLKSILSEPSHNGWQSLLFPVFDGKDLYQARLHIRDLPDQEKEKNKGRGRKSAGTRFVVEVQTTAFGEMQLDGLVRKDPENKHFDLIIRSHNDMDDEMKNDIRNIFITASEITGFRGEVDFTVMREFPLKLFDDLLEQQMRQAPSHKGFEV